MKVTSAGGTLGRMDTTPSWSWSVALRVLGVALVVAVAAARGILGGLLIGGAVFIVLERVVPIRRQPVLRPGWATDAAHLVLTQALALGATIALGLIPVALLRAVDLGGLQDTVGAQPAWLQAGEGLLVVGVGLYWVHRLSHTTPWLWRFHAVHHSSETLDWLASGRLHPVDLAISNVAIFVPLTLLGFDRSTFGLALVVLTVTPILNHSNIRLRLPGLRWVVPNPEAHHWHHARAPVNVNFAPFPFVDAVFGTAHLPRAWPASYGIDDPVPAEGWVRQLAWPFRRTERATITA